MLQQMHKRFHDLIPWEKRKGMHAVLRFQANTDDGAIAAGIPGHEDRCEY